MPQIDIKQNRAELFQYILENEHLIDAIVDVSNVDDNTLENFANDVDDILANIGFISAQISKDDVISALRTYSYDNIKATVDNIFSHSSFVNVLVEINKMRVMWPHYAPTTDESSIYVANVLNDKLNNLKKQLTHRRLEVIISNDSLRRLAPHKWISRHELMCLL